MLILSPQTHKLLRGESCWKILLTSGKTITEDQRSFDLLRGHRLVNWFLDIASTGDCARIKELTLCTPAGEHTLTIAEPYSAFQFSQNTMGLLSGERQQCAQIIGRVDDKATGACSCIIWDALDHTVHTNHRTNIHDFTSWRRGTPDLKALNYPAMGVRL